MARGTPIEDLRPVATRESVQLSWRWRGRRAPVVRLLRSSEWYPNAPDDFEPPVYGTVRLSEAAVSTYLDRGLRPDEHYYYSLFARRRDGSWCRPVQAVVWTSVEEPSCVVHGDRALQRAGAGPADAAAALGIGLLLPIATVAAFFCALTTTGWAGRISLAATIALLVVWRIADDPDHDARYLFDWLALPTVLVALWVSAEVFFRGFGAILGVSFGSGLGLADIVRIVATLSAALGVWLGAGLLYEGPRRWTWGHAALVASSCLLALVAPLVAVLALSVLAAAVWWKSSSSGGALNPAWVERRRPQAADDAAEESLRPVPAATAEAAAGEHLFWLLLVLWVLNFADFLLTWEGTRLGVFEEANGVMAYLLGAGTGPAFAFKMLVMTVAVLAMWRLRHHPWIVRLAVVLVVAFGVLVAYEALALLWP